MVVRCSEVLAFYILQVKGYAQLGHGHQKLRGSGAYILQVKGYAQLGHGHQELRVAGRL